MISFILNNQPINTERQSGTPLLDFIRYEMNLPGSKAGCREGDCGACTVLEGTLKNGVVSYISVVSCLTPLANVHGKHIVTIEGINMDYLSPVQKAIIENNATQCGFCTPGFVMSLTAFALSQEKPNKENAIAYISGNICRCTGYKSIEKVAEDLADLLKNKDLNDPVNWLVKNRFLPIYFSAITERLSEINRPESDSSVKEIIVAGGTDLLVNKAEEFNELNISTFSHREDLKGIRVENNRCIIGASTTTSEIEHSSIINALIPEISSYFRLIASKSIRNMGTIGGNIVNASPIGDLIILFLALNSDIILIGSGGSTTVPLKEFFTGYKKLKIRNDEIVKSIVFTLPQKQVLFNFEKVSKRKHLDIASVNSAIQITADNNRIRECSLSAGGVSPIPLFLTRTCDFLTGKIISNDIILQANIIMQEEITPISDIRGSRNYKRLLLRQLFFAHFIKLFPGNVYINKIVQIT
jgi:xanthine dehydrogenase small subunit